jgi:Lipin/Ned1/Smp2 multi-domain protein middle domain
LKPTSKRQLISDKIKSVFNYKNTDEDQLIPKDKDLDKNLIDKEEKKVVEGTLNPIQQDNNYQKYSEDESTDDDQQLAMSLCRSFITDIVDDEELVNVFNRNRITFEEFSSNPNIYLTNPELMIRIHDGLYLPEHGIP